ncbi:MAG: hypothetical protein ACRDFR_09020, partial [Candidatus Limnocylindria bacterium]
RQPRPETSARITTRLPCGASEISNDIDRDGRREVAVVATAMLLEPRALDDRPAPTTAADWTWSFHSDRRD